MSQEPHIRSVSARDTAKFLKTHKKTVEVFQITINEVKELLQAEVNSRKTGCVYRRIEDLVERYRSTTFRERVPDNLPRPSPDMPHAEIKIPLIDGAIPVKMRAFPISHGEILILQQLLADLVIEKGYVEPADPMSQWSAPVMILKKSGNQEGVTNQYRLVTDFRRLNALTKSSTYTPLHPLFGKSSEN